MYICIFYIYIFIYVYVCVYIYKLRTLLYAKPLPSVVYELLTLPFQ